MKRQFAAHEIVDACGLRVLKRQRRLAARFEEPAKFAGELRVHDGAVEGDALPGVDHHRPADEDGRIVMLDGIQHGLALRKIASRREADEQARLQSPMNRGFGAGRNLAAGRQQRSIKVDGNQFKLHGVTIAFKGETSKFPRRCKLIWGYQLVFHKMWYDMPAGRPLVASLA